MGFKFFPYFGSIKGYKRITQRVLATREAISEGAASLGLPTFGDPQLCILAYGSPEHDIAAIGAGLNARGWVAGFSKEPPGIHHMLNLTHEPVVGRYLSDLSDAMDDVRKAGKDAQDRQAVQAQY